MKRQLNSRLLLLVAGAVVALATAVHFVHAYQVRCNAGALRRQAEWALEKKDLARAVDYLNQYLTMEPGDVEALALLGRTLDNLGTPTARMRAFLVLDDVLRREPDRDADRFRLAHGAIALGRYRDAVHHLGQLAARWPEPGLIEHRIGWCHEAAGDYDKAADAFAHAVRKSPTRLESYQLLAEVLEHRLRQPDEALRVMNDMVTANGQSYQAHLLRAGFQRRHGNLAAAADDMRLALELAPHRPDVLLAAGELALAQGRPADARGFIERGLAEHPSSALYRALAGLELRQGRSDQALAALRRGIERLPKARDLPVALADLLLDRGEVKQARQIVAELESQGPPTPLTDYLRGRMLIMSKEWPSATALLERVSREQGLASEWSGSVQLLLGRCYQHAGDTRRALTAFDRAVKLDPTRAAARLGLGAALVSAGRFNDGFGELAHVTQAADAPPETWGTLARLAARLLERRRYVESDQVLQLVESSRGLDKDMARLAAEIALANRDAAKAVRCMSLAVSPKTRDYRDLLWMARILRGAGQTEQTEVSLRLAVDVAPHAPDTWVALVEHLTRDGQTPRAEQIMAQAAERLPSDRRPLALARCEEILGRFDRAEEHLRLALEDRPSEIAPLSYAADFYLRTEQPAKAEPILRQLAGSAAGDLAALSRRRLAVLLAGRESSADHKEALSLLPPASAASAASAEQRARAYVMSARADQRTLAIRMFEETLSVSPPTSEEEFWLVRMYDAATQDAQAREHMLALLVHDEQPQYLAYYIRRLLQRDEVDDARTHVDRLQRLEPFSPRTRELRQAVRKADSRKN